MWLRIVVFVAGSCMLFSFYMAFLGLRAGENGAFLFAAFGLFFGIPFISAVFKIASGKRAFLKAIDEKISGKPGPVSFVPHRFMMAAIIIVVLCVLFAVLIPVLMR